jgi:hypothetical protein
MTARTEVLQLVARTRAASGVPERVEDPAVIERVAVIVRAGAEREAATPKGRRLPTTPIAAEQPGHGPA